VRALVAVACVVLATLARAQSDIIVDNPAGAPVGSWPTGSNDQFFGTNFYINEAGTGADTFTWPATIPAAGAYSVYAWWPDGGSGRATNAKYIVNHAGGSTTVTVNQQAQVGQWNLLGTFILNEGPATVVLSDNANGRVAADAIKWGAPVAPPPPSADIIVDNAAGTVTSGNWQSSSSASGHFGQNYRFENSPIATDKFTWTGILPTGGQYRVYAWWTGNDFGLASDAKYTVNHAGGSTMVTVNQQINGGQWNLLGTFTFNAGQASIWLAGPANAEIVADAVRWEPVAPPPVGSMHFIHADHLNTPRLVANDQGQTVWKWDQQEPFGGNLANEDPDANSVAFEFPLRFPGQYADKETNLFYNYFRDYDPTIGRYGESDPIGLRGGINTYAYVSLSPLSAIDADGLKGIFPEIPKTPQQVLNGSVNSARLYGQELGMQCAQQCKRISNKPTYITADMVIFDICIGLAPWAHGHLRGSAVIEGCTSTCSVQYPKVCNPPRSECDPHVTGG
jgi:RHS repeat-associated protein